MKWLCTLLLALNVVYFGWEYTRGIERPVERAQPSPSTVPGTEPLRLLAELERSPGPRLKKQADTTPAGIKQIAKQESPSRQERTEPAPQVTTSLAELPDCGVSPFARVPASFLPNRPRCHVIGPFSSVQSAVEYEKLLHKSGAQAKQTAQECKESLGRFWVFLPAQKSEGWVLKQLADLEQRGIEDFFAIRMGPMKNAISLGVYSTVGSARRRIEQLRSKGIHPALAPHYQVRTRSWLEVKLAAVRLPAELPARVRAHRVECDKIAAAEATP